jgi:hypothetical protein
VLDDYRDVQFTKNPHVIPEPVFLTPPARVFGQKEHERLFPGQPCYYCGDPAQSVDHMIPRSKGGQRGANLVPACHRCNQMKSDLTVEEFIDRLKLVLRTLESRKVIQAGKDVLQCPLAA